jgi:hypothetical protein
VNGTRFRANTINDAPAFPRYYNVLSKVSFRQGLEANLVTAIILSSDAVQRRTQWVCPIQAVKITYAELCVWASRFIEHGLASYNLGAKHSVGEQLERVIDQLVRLLIHQRRGGATFKAKFRGARQVSRAFHKRYRLTVPSRPTFKLHGLRGGADGASHKRYREKARDERAEE